VASAGYVKEWQGSNAWWNNAVSNTAENDVTQYYISDFSAKRDDSRGQDLDVAAPGSWVVGPYQVNQSNRASLFFLGGTSMASPHVAGIVALMLDQSPTLGVDASGRAAEAEDILERAAVQIVDNNQQVREGPGAPLTTPPSWTDNRSGHGLVTADAALALTPGS
jgi:subtilisin family serine protease